MKGTNPTKAQKAYWGAVAQNGCVACKKDGHYNNHVSIHHMFEAVGLNEDGEEPSDVDDEEPNTAVE